MNARVFKIARLRSFVAAAIVATIPQMVLANDLQSKTVTTTTSNTATTKTADSVEIANLKRQLFLCHQHRMHRRHSTACIAPKPTAQVIEKTTVIEKPVVIEKVVEKQVFVDRPAEVAVVQPVAMDRAVLVEHSKHRRHLLHLGFPFLGSVTLF